MDTKKELKTFAILSALCTVFYFLPVGDPVFSGALNGALSLLKSYAREHVLMCLVPAFFIAGAIAVFISQGAVMKYLGPKAGKFVAYSVASISGSILAVCSCTVLPLFAGIWKMGAGLGPACAFLYSGPAINILAIVLTARILGFEMGVARAVGAISFSVIIGLAMHFIFRNSEERAEGDESEFSDAGEGHDGLLMNAVQFAALCGILIFANWADSKGSNTFWDLVFSAKWIITGFFALLLGVVLKIRFGVPVWKIAVAAFLTVELVWITGNTVAVFAAAAAMFCMILASSGEKTKCWLESSWTFTRQMLPLLFAGIFVSGFLLGAPGTRGVIPPDWIAACSGGNGLLSNFIASLAGALMYFATLTEVPILQGLMANGMGKGPALALLLAGPALSLPSMIVITQIMGAKRALTFISLVVLLSTAAGYIYGNFF